LKFPDYGHPSDDCPEGLLDLWWHLASRATLLASLSCYIDDSGTDYDSKISVIGGPLFPRKSFFAFEYEWDRKLALHRVAPPIHMKEFAPRARLSYLNAQERRALFHDLVKVINDHKQYSITTEIENQEFREHFPGEKYKGLFGPAPLAFFWCMMLNHLAVRDHPSLKQIAYVVSQSSENGQMMESHRFFREHESQIKEFYTGAISFDTPVAVNALQAADMIAWANRRKRVNKFVDGFEPLELLTRYVKSSKRSGIHFHYPISAKSTKALGGIVAEGIPAPKKIGNLDLTGLFFR